MLIVIFTVMFIVYLDGLLAPRTNNNYKYKILQIICNLREYQSLHHNFNDAEEQYH